MTIRAKLAINVISLVGFFLIIALILNIASPGIEDATGKGEFANHIVIGVSDMNTITYDYVMNPSERARQQWERKHASLGKLIASAKFTKRDMRAILNRIRENHEETAQFFKGIIENNRKKKQAAAAVRALLDESNERNVTQLMARSQLMISDAYSLSRISHAEIRNVQSWSYRLISAAILIAMLVAGAISFFLTRSIDVSIRTLKKGTEIVAGGDLTHRVTARGKDEIATLAQAFNDMTGRLSTSYKSLAEEVWDKEKAREALHIANLYTRSLIEVSLDPLVTISTDGKIMDVNHATELATGVSREQLIGSNFSSYFTDPEKAQEGYGQVFSRGFVRDYPLVIRHVSGRTM
ncbi:MAG: HAMP domain-containing protein, partial [Proteobacteria bacterium]|nr:HAMP domain-containing protein [Pseudomonadota bacterium]